MTVEKASKSATKAAKGSDEALVVGGGVAGMQAALDIANQGFKVHLLEKSPSIGGRMAMIDKTFPTLDCSACILTPKLSEVSRHPNIELLSYSDVHSVGGKAGDFHVKVRQKTRFIDADKCSGCGDCVEPCPVEVPNEFDQNIGFRKAVYVPFPQATPNTHTIDKKGHPACKIACPAHVNAQGFLALMADGKHERALKLVRDAIPFPGTLGRVCPGLCEEHCERATVDASISIRNNHRWLADYERLHKAYAPEPPAIDKKEKVAVIGAGPAGLACAEKLAKLGYPVTVFEARKEPGGLLRYGIPEYRLPRDTLSEEISMITDLGVKIKLGKRIDSIKELQEIGFQSVFIATGAPVSSKLRVSGEESKGVFHALDFLDDVNSGKEVPVGRHVAIIGGGNAAIDAARVAQRRGAHEVTIIYRRSRKEMPAIHTEIEDALEEGINLLELANPIQILQSRGEVVGIKCVRMKLGEPDDSGRRRPIPVPESEFALQLDNVIIAIGQRVGPEGPHNGVELSEWGTPVADEVTFQSSIPWVFAGGDVLTGGGTVVDAVAHGHEAAESIHRYLRGSDLAAGRPFEFRPIPSEEVSKEGEILAPRAPMPKVTMNKRLTSFEEVEQGFDERTAMVEAGRCLECAVCSECLQCVEACTREAIDHSMEDEIVDLHVGAIVLATGFELFDVEKYPRFGYHKYENVIHALEYERLINAAGPTHGHLIRLSDGRVPHSIGFVQCVGARDVTMGVPYCSRVCCMYGIKNAVMAKEHYPDVDVTLYYTDIRSFGKGFEEFYQMAKRRFGVKFVRGRVAEITETTDGDNLLLRYENIEDGYLSEAEHELVVLSPGILPPEGLQVFEEQLGIDISDEGYVEVKHEFLQPVDTTVPGVFVCGCTDSPKDIPDSVTAAGAAAMRATIILSKEGNN
ncbi:MAG: FAD-dependent oxidoreductase [Candidatus Thorarchaeota archaeon]|jgi:heterodisulfide reductase subunit A-like polyferredoxin